MKRKEEQNEEENKEETSLVRDRGETNVTSKHKRY